MRGLFNGGAIVAGGDARAVRQRTVHTFTHCSQSKASINVILHVSGL